MGAASQSDETDPKQKPKMRAIQKVPTATDQYSRVTPTEASAKDHGPLGGTGLGQNRTQAEEKERQALHEAAIAEGARMWCERAKNKKWDEVRAPLSVYDYSGAKVQEDPRKNEESAPSPRVRRVP